MTDRTEPQKKRRQTGGSVSFFNSAIASGPVAAPGASGPARDYGAAQGAVRQKIDEPAPASADRSLRVPPPVAPVASARIQAEQAKRDAQQRAGAVPAGSTSADAVCDLDALAADCIWQLHHDGKHVSVNDVEQLMCKRLGRDRLPLGGRPITMVVPRVKQLDRDLNRIQVYIQAYLMNPVCTVHDLGQKLAASVATDSKKSFDDLGLGPLTKVPVVYERFKCPSTVVEISPADVISCMRKHLDKANRDDPNSRLTAESFMLLLAEDYGCTEDDVYRLGVRIRSIPLLIQEVARAKREANATLREARERQKTELLNELAEQMKLLKRYFSEALDRRVDRGVSLRRKYMHMSPLDVLKDAWQRCSDYVTTNRVKEKVISLLSELSKDPTASQLFQLAVCSAQVASPADSDNIASSKLRPPATATSGSSNSQTQQNFVESAAGAAAQQRPAVSRKEIIEAIKRSVSRREVEFVRIEDLKAVEEDLRRMLNVKDFFECGYGSFITFFCGCAKDLNDAGFNLVLAADGGARLREHRALAASFTRHYYSVTGSSAQLTLAEQNELVRRLQVQFGIKHLHELGVTSLQSLLSYAGLAVDRSSDSIGAVSLSQSGHRGDGDGNQRNRSKKAAAAASPSVTSRTAALAHQDQPVLFEVACTRTETGDGVAELGSSIAVNQTEYCAFQCILNAPLLEDIKSWTQWDLVFESKLGNITKFIMENYQKMPKKDFGAQASYGLKALLTRDGRLLRIPANGCSVEAFGSRVAAADARGAAAYLTGLACIKGTTALPLQLLASHVQKKLMEMATGKTAENRLPKSDDSRVANHQLLDFVLTALVLLPLQIAQHAARQVFLGPLAAAMGSQTKAENDLYIWGKRHGHDAVLERLGLVLGIHGWAELFDRKLEPMDTVCEAMPATDGLAKEHTNDLSDKTCEDEKEKCKEKGTQGENDTALATQTNIPNESVSHSGSCSDTSTDSTVTPVLIASEDACLAVVNDIRKKYDVDSIHKESEASLNLKRQLGNSLERLSRELYNSNTHFVLELIQNADDNRYGSGVTPTLLFVIDESAIVLYNNEEGFSELDIRAISAIGQSTKGKHKQGYIGQKGIGFKSVFTVTDAPEVHSNGYHICFDLRQGPMGYILPSWVQGKPPASPKGHTISDTSWNTTIVLPLKGDSDEDRSSVQCLTNSFYDLKPILLLFLHRLRQISFIMKSVQNKTIHMRRKDVSEHLLQLEFDKISHLWLVSRMRLEAAEELQVDVQSTELSLAFPVFQEKKHYEPYLTKPEKKPMKQQTFAYLPLRDFGFKFVLQADFEIPSSRQDVRHDSKWNEWIREAIPRAFMQSRELFLELQNLDRIEASIYFLKFVPLPGEISGFFEPVAQGVLERLWRTPVIPIQSKEKGVEWKTPSEVIMCPKELQAVVPASLLTGKLHLHYAIPQFVDGLGEELLMTMGVRKLDSPTVLELLQTMYDDYQAKKQNVPLKECAKWLSIIYHFINDDYRQKTLSTIAAMKIFWLSDKKVISLSKSQAVFLPEVSGKTKDQHALKLLKSDLLIISDELLICQNELANAQVKEVLDLLGVCAPTTSEIIGDYIIPTLRSPAWQEKTDAILVAYVQIIFRDWSENRNVEWLSDTKCCLRLLTSKGERVCSAERDVYLTPLYFNSVDLARSYPAYQWCLVSDVYVSRGTSDGDRRAWKEFLLLHGLKEIFEVELQKSTRFRVNLENTLWRAYLDIVPRDITGELDIEDYDCPVLRELIDSKDPTTLTSVYDELVCNWDGKYSLTEVARIRAPLRKQPFELPSTFVLMLRSRDWMPCVKMADHLTGKMDDVHFRTPSTVWLADPKLMELLSSTVDYSRKTSVLPSVKFCKAVKLNWELPAVRLLEFLKNWPQASNAAEDVAVARVSSLSPGVPFITSVLHMSCVYQYLQEFAPLPSREAFQNEALVFIPNQNDDKAQHGNFVPLKVLRWSDPTRLFAKYRPEFFDEQTGEKLSYIFIEPYYRKLKKFFVDFLKIDEEPSLRQYCLLLQHISQNDPKLTKDSLKAAKTVYSALGRKCRDSNLAHDLVINQQYAGPLRMYAREMPILASSAGNWTCLTERLLLDDDPELGDLFRQAKVPVAFFAVDATDDVSLFCKALKIERLSVRAEKESVLVGLRPSVHAHQYVSQLLPWVQRFLLSKARMKRLYDDLTSTGIESAAFPESRLRNIFQVKSIELVVRLKGWDECTVKRTKECEYVDSERNIYLQYSIVEGEHAGKMYNYLHDALALVFRTNEDSYSEFKELINGFLSQAKSFLVDHYPNTESEFVKKHGLQPIPDGVLPWSLPQLIIKSEEKPFDFTLSADQAYLYGGLVDASPATENSGSLTCWPPRQYDTNQGAGMQKGASSVRQPLPEFAKKLPPPPPAAEISADKTAEGGSRKRDESPAGDASSKNTGPGQTSSEAKGHVKQHQATSTSAANKDDHENKHKRSTDTGQTGQAGNAATSASSENKAVITGAEAQASDRPEHEAVTVNAEKSVVKQVYSKGFAETTHPTREQHGFLQCLDFSQLDCLPEVVPMETDIGAVLTSLRPELFEQHDRIADQAVGYRGELCVYHYLCKKHESAIRGGEVAIEWVNCGGEVGRPYDIVVRELVKKHARYIEVKSTRTEDKCCFELSIHQVKFALENTENYSLYRVYNASAPTVADIKLRILNDLATMMKTKKVGLYIII